MNDSPASASLWLIAVATAGPRKANTSSAKRDAGGQHVVGHPQVVVRGGLPEPRAADVQPQLVGPALEAGVRRQLSRRNRDAEAEHGLAAHPFDPFDAAHQVDEHDGGQRRIR